MARDTYNGWATRETWLVNLWLGETFDKADLSDMRLHEVARCFEEMAEEMLAGFDETSVEGRFAFDLMHTALARVNWLELAETRLDTFNAA